MLPFQGSALDHYANPPNSYCYSIDTYSSNAKLCIGTYVSYPWYNSCMKYTLITGPTSGIGYHFAHEAARVGMALVLVGRDELKLTAIADEFRGTYDVDVQEIVTDLSHASAAQYVFDEVEKRGISVSYLINNAGVGDFAYVRDADEHKLASMMTLNMVTLTLLTKLFLPQVILNTGKILHVASTAAFEPGPTMAVYYATKSYVLSFSEALREELKKTGVTVTTLCPGPTASEFQKTADMGTSPLVQGKKLPTAEEVAHYGWRSMMQGKGVVVHGFANRIFTRIIPFVPRIVVTAAVHKMQGNPRK